MMYTTTEAADLLEKQYYQLTYLLKTHRALDVPQFNCRRMFTPDDILVLAKAFHLPDEKIAALALRFAAGTSSSERNSNI